jgi:F0F1-type ATP synthase assembly protein I
MRVGLVVVGLLALVAGVAGSLRAAVAVRERVDDADFVGERDAAWDRFAGDTRLGLFMALLGFGAACLVSALVLG